MESKVELKLIISKYLKFIKSTKDDLNLDKINNKSVISSSSLSLDSELSSFYFYFIETFLNNFDKYSENAGYKNKKDYLELVIYIIKYFESSDTKNLTFPSNETVINKINQFFKNSEVTLSRKNENSTVSLLLVYNFLIKNSFNDILINNLYHLLNTLFKMSIKYAKIKDALFTTTSLILDVFEKYVEKFISNKLFKFSPSALKPHIKRFYNFKKTSFYFGINNPETLISRQIINNILSRIDCTINEIPENFQLNHLKLSMGEAFNYSYNNKECKGRFGFCSICYLAADFYCVSTRLPICSIACKDKLNHKINFFDFLNYYEVIKNSNLETESNTLTILDDNFQENIDGKIAIIKLFLEDIINFINKAYFENEKINIKAIILSMLATIQKLLKILDYLVNFTYLEDIKPKLINICMKCIQNGDILITELTLELLLSLFKNYLYYLKSDFIFILEELLSFLVICTSNGNKQNKILKFLYELFKLEDNKLYLILYNNYDLSTKYSNLSEKFIDTLIKLLIDVNVNPIVKTSTIKFFKLIIKSLIFNSKLNTITTKDDKRFLLIQNTDYVKNNFNKQHKKIVEYLEEKLFINDNENSKETIAKFLRYTNGLDKEKVGEYLGFNAEFNQDVLKCYLNTFDFIHLPINEAVRQFLFCFKISGEGQVISRVMQAFSEKYFKDNQNNSFCQSSDAVFYLACNILILHTSLHNPKVHKSDKMTLNVFCSSLKGLNDGTNFNEAYLKEIYENIENNKFVTLDYNTYSNTNQLNEPGNNSNLESLKLSLTISKFSEWDTSDIETMDISKIILYIFDILKKNFEALISIKDKKYLNEFYEFIVFCLILFSKNRMDGYRSDLISSIIKYLDFYSFIHLDESYIKNIKLFVKVIKLKPELFDICWGKLCYYFLNKQTLIKNFLKHAEEVQRTTITEVYKLYSNDLIDFLISDSVRLDPENLYSSINHIFAFLLEDLERNKVLHLLIGSIIIDKLLNNADPNLWNFILEKFKKILQKLLFSYSTPSNNTIFVEYLLMIYNKILKIDFSIDSIIDLVSDISFIILKNESFSFKYKTIFNKLSDLPENSVAGMNMIFNMKMLEVYENLLPYKESKPIVILFISKSFKKFIEHIELTPSIIKILDILVEHNFNDYKSNLDIIIKRDLEKCDKFDISLHWSKIMEFLSLNYKGNLKLDKINEITTIYLDNKLKNNFVPVILNELMKAISNNINNLDISILKSYIKFICKQIDSIYILPQLEFDSKSKETLLELFELIITINIDFQEIYSVLNDLIFKILKSSSEIINTSIEFMQKINLAYSFSLDHKHEINKDNNICKGFQKYVATSEASPFICLEYIANLITAIESEKNLHAVLINYDKLKQLKDILIMEMDLSLNVLNIQKVNLNEEILFKIENNIGKILCLFGIVCVLCKADNSEHNRLYEIYNKQVLNYITSFIGSKIQNNNFYEYVALNFKIINKFFFDDKNMNSKEFTNTVIKAFICNYEKLRVTLIDFMLNYNSR